MPQVSVVIPTYNRKDLLLETIESVRQQSYRDYEILVADDGSTDGTLECLNQHYGSEIRVLNLRHSGLPAVGRNAGVEAASGSWIAFLDSDDLWLPHTLACHMKAALTDSQAALFYGRAEAFNRQGMKGLTVQGEHAKSGMIFDRLILRNCIPTLTVMVRRDIFKKVGLFDVRPEYRAVEDYDQWLRIAYRYPVHFIPEVLGRYRLHDENTSRGIIERIDRWEKVLQNIFQICEVRPGLRRRALANLDVERFKYILCASGAAQEAPDHLRRALQKDPFHLPARLLYGLVLAGAVAPLRSYLQRSRNPSHAS